MTQEESDEDEDAAEGDYWFCWEEADWENNKLFYENDLEHLEELPSRVNRSSATQNK